MTGFKSTPVVSISHLSRTFGHTRALADVNLNVQPGQVFGIVGENGAGKTTLIKHILGLYKPETGRVRVFGECPVDQPEAMLARIGYLSEEPELPAWMTVDELLNYTAAFYRSWDATYAQELIQVFGLDRSLRVRNLSKGMRAQLGLVLAQAHRPELLLLDEPSSGLDPNVRRDILVAIIETVVEEGRTVIFSSHLLEEVERVSDHLMMLKQGEVILDEPLEKVLNSHHRVTLKCASAPPFSASACTVLRSEAVGTEWQVDCHGSLEAIRHQAQTNGIEITALHALSLNDIFLLRSQHPVSSGQR